MTLANFFSTHMSSAVQEHLGGATDAAPLLIPTNVAPDLEQDGHPYMLFSAELSAHLQSEWAVPPILASGCNASVAESILRARAGPTGLPRCSASRGCPDGTNFVPVRGGCISGECADKHGTLWCCARVASW